MFASHLELVSENLIFYSLLMLNNNIFPFWIEKIPSLQLKNITKLNRKSIKTARKLF